MNERRFEILSRQTCYDGFFRLECVRLRHSLFAGGMSPEIARELIERADVAAVLPYDPVLDKVVLIEQFRIGALADASGPWLLEVVAGLIEPGEAAQDVARREMREETGLCVMELVPITTFYPSPSKTSERSHLFCGRVDSAGAGGVHGLAHEGEDIRVLSMPADEALDELARGRINSAWPIIALQWLALNRERLRSAWLAK